MTAINGDRPATVGKSHKRRRIISERNRALLGAYQSDMRMELRDVLNVLRSDTLTLAERERRWKFAAFLARELGDQLEEPAKLHPPAAVDVPPTAANF